MPPLAPATFEIQIPARAQSSSNAAARMSLSRCITGGREMMLMGQTRKSTGVWGRSACPPRADIADDRAGRSKLPVWLFFFPVIASEIPCSDPQGIDAAVQITSALFEPSGAARAQVSSLYFSLFIRELGEETG